MDNLLPELPSTRKKKLPWKWIALAVTLLICVASFLVHSRFEGQGWTHYSSSNSGLTIGGVSALAIDARGQVWVGTYGGLSVLAPNGQWTTYTLPNSEYGWHSVIALAIDPDGQVWVGTWGGEGGEGLSVLAPNGRWITLYTEGNSGLASNFVTALAIDTDGQVWVGTDGGLSVLASDGDWTTYTEANSGLTSNIVSALAIDVDGQVWVGTQSQHWDNVEKSEVLSVLAPNGQWATYTEANSGLTSNLVSAMAIDADGQVWVGTYEGGLSVLAPNGQWTNYTEANSVLTYGSSIDAIVIDADGQVWVGAGGRLRVLAPNGQWTTYTEDNSGLTGYGVFDLMIDSTGQLWIGTSKGISVLDPADCTAPGVIQEIRDIRNVIMAASIIIGIYITFSWMVQRRKAKRSRQLVEQTAAEAPEEDIEVF